MQLQKFILKILFLATILVGTYYAAAYKLAISYTDPNYSKFTYQTNNLVIGISRAHDGISPKIVDSILGENHPYPTLNFAFEKSQSSFGKEYLEAILQKIDSTKTDGLFIISVTPGSFLISEKFGDIPPDDIDKNTMIGKMSTFNKHPNLEFVRKCYDGALYRSFLPKKEMLRKFHKDGWLEFRNKINNYTVTDVKIEQWKEHTNTGYELVKQYQKPSLYRLNYLKTTIRTLKKYGKVVVIRMPVDESFLMKEKLFWTDFDDQIVAITNSTNAPYLNYTKTEYNYKMYDGSHMFGESAKRFTILLCEDIKNLKNY